VTLFAPDHPYWHVTSAVMAADVAVQAVTLSYYYYVPQSLIDSRIGLAVSVDDFLDIRFMERLIAECPPGAEVALHSEVIVEGGGVRHIPMIDMSTGSAAQLLKLKPFLERHFEGFAWFKSGRSYHGYGSNLVERDEWIAIMGRLLLANQIGMPATVDPRWVGHRLMAGYAALRWTKNTSHYVDFPKRLI
jgi:hypothetical protein